MRRARIATIAVMAAAAVGGGSATALAHGGGDHRGSDAHRLFAPGPDIGALKGRTCTIPDAQKLTIATSTALARLDTRLDAAVAANRITQAEADARFARAVTRLSVAKIVGDAGLAPVLSVLGMTADELADAWKDGTTVRELLEEKGVTRDQLRTAFKAGRTAAKTALDTVCPVTDPSPKDGKGHRDHKG
jgi:hypothetical protein